MGGRASENDAIPDVRNAKVQYLPKTDVGCAEDAHDYGCMLRVAKAVAETHPYDENKPRWALADGASDRWGFSYHACEGILRYTWSHYGPPTKPGVPAEVEFSGHELVNDPLPPELFEP
jgi:hypothetical protein